MPIELWHLGAAEIDQTMRGILEPLGVRCRDARRDEHGKKAVFFVIGDKVRRFPDLAREIVRRGHQMGNHTMTHPAGTMWCAGSRRTRRR